MPTTQELIDQINKSIGGINEREEGNPLTPLSGGTQEKKRVLRSPGTAERGGEAERVIRRQDSELDKRRSRLVDYRH